MTRANPEAALQISVKKYLAIALPPSLLWTASLTGTNLSMQARTRAKAMGVKRGFPDLQFLFPDGVTRYIELKSPTGVLSPEQRIFRHYAHAARPDIWAVCRTLDEVIETLARWGAPLRDRNANTGMSSGGLAAG